MAAIHDQLRRESDWDLDSLESVLATLHDVRASQDLWILYWQVLDPDKRNRLGGIVSLQPTLEKFRQRIFEVQVLVDVDTARVSHSDREETKTRLALIDQQIDDWMKDEQP